VDTSSSVSDVDNCIVIRMLLDYIVNIFVFLVTIHLLEIPVYWVSTSFIILHRIYMNELWCKGTLKLLYIYSIIKLYKYITCLGGGITLLFWIRNTNLICVTPFCSTDPFSLLLQILPAKGMSFPSSL
jgi:hypothetical protein